MEELFEQCAVDTRIYSAEGLKEKRVRRGERLGHRGAARQNSWGSEVRAAAERYIQEERAKKRRAEIEQRFGTGEITRESEAEFLRGLPDTVGMTNGQGVRILLEKIKEDSEQAQMFALVAGRDANMMVEMTEADVVRFLQTDQGRPEGLDTPVGFGLRRRVILGNLKPMSDDETYQGYVQAMNRLEEDLYGEKFEYYREMERQNKAARKEGKRRRGENVMRAVNADGAEATRELGQKKFEMYRNDERRQEMLLRNAVIEGDPWMENGQIYRLTPEVLAANGLEPKYMVKVGGREVDLSDIYMMDDDGRYAAVGYVPTEEGVKVRTYYQSKSQGMWRYLPDYVKEPGAAGMEWYGKGYSEESVILPAELQQAFATIQGMAPTKRVQTNPEFIAGGAAMQYNSTAEYVDKMYKQQMRGDFYREVRPQPMTVEFGMQHAGMKQEPERVVVAPGREPDFGQLLMSYKGENPNVGEMDWLMCTDGRGRSWVGGIESTSPVTSTGCRRDWVAGGDVTTPLYEYGGKQDGGYGDFGDRKGRYLGMWKDYVSKMPLVRKYEEFKRWRMERLA